LEKEFRDYLRQGVAAHLKEVAPQFELVKRVPGSKSAGAVLWRWIPREPLHCFFILEFARDRHFVKLNIGWSKLTKYPGEIDYEHDIWPVLRDANYDIEALDQLPEATLTPAEFGQVKAYFEMGESSPSPARLKQAYETAGASEAIKTVEGGQPNQWRGDLELQTWSAMKAFAGTSLTEQDAHNAVGPLLERMCAFVDQHYLPYFEQTVPRLLLVLDGNHTS
jgi:hypothetical protein